jgi:zinc protease
LVATLDRRAKNGARVIVLGGGRHAGSGVVAVQLWVAAGTSAERDDEHGCAHLLEHMSFKPYAAPGGETDLALSIEELGGDVNAFTSHDETVFHATVPAAAGEQAVRVLLDAVLAPKFDPAELKRERQVVLEEIKQYDDDPASRAMQDLVKMLFGTDAYARPVLGRASEVRSHDAAKLRKFHREVYASEKLCLVVAGPVDTSRVWTTARASLARAPKRSRRVRRERPVPRRRPPVKISRRDVNEVTIRLGFLGPDAQDDDAVALDALAIALGQGDSSRLMTQTRRGAQLVSDVHASFLAFARSGTFLVSAQTTLGKTTDATQAMLDQVDELTRAPLDPEEFARARAVLQSGLVYRRETVQGQAHTAGQFATLAGRLEAEDEYYSRLDQLTPEQARVAAARYLQRQSAAAVVVVPESTTDVAAAKELTKSIRRTLTKKRVQKRARTKRDRLGVVHAQLDCGLRVRALPVREVPIVAGWMVWPGGLRLEDSRYAGVNHLAASLLIRGTVRRTGDDLAREVDGLAAVLDGFSGRNSVGLQFECLSQHVPNLLQRTIECAVEPEFPEDEMEDEKRVTAEELDAEHDDVGQIAYRSMLEALYGEHPYHRNIRGSRETLAKITQEVVRTTWERDYPIGRAVLALAGDFDPQETIDRLAASLEDRGIAGPPPPRLPQWPGPPPAWPKGPETRTHERERAQSHVVIGYPGIELGDPRASTLDVLLTVLGGQSGRLFLALREREGLVYNVGATSTEGIDGGHITLYASMSHDKRERAIEVIGQELARLRDEKIDAAELERAKSWLVGQHAAGNQRRARLGSHLAFGEVYDLGVGHFLEYPKRTNRVTAKAIREVASELLDPTHQVMSIVRDKS